MNTVNYEELFKEFPTDSMFDEIVEEKAVLLIKQINEEKKFWETKQERRINPVPNMSGRAAGSLGTSMVTENIFSNYKIDDAFLKNIFNVIKNSKRICLHVSDGPFGFYPIFGIIYNNNNLVVNNNHPDYEYLLRFKEKQLTESMFEEIKTILYSTENIAKHKPFLLEKIHKIEHYEY